MKNLLSSRKFWTLVVGLIVTIVAQFLPNFALDEERASALLVIAASYMVGVAIDPGGGWQSVLRSRKFWAAAIGLAVVILTGFGVKLIFTEDQLVEIALLLSGYILSVAVEKQKPITG